MAKRIMETNGGKTELESYLGKGTTFIAYLRDEPLKTP
ncbi:sensor histidine kinase [Rhodocytophaga aerolata]|uniref:Sensor histidine kinase n=1 Tax=Rhodocytophaga aerolata TaxID=455078 RepID=A0ABT8R5P7_9BACT|nr:sensor histidine kinase [Rhodocytophaga aerolata]MDO1446709.1 sensor histidine kinase [Rhodocytophaga aerolata]